MKKKIRLAFLLSGKGSTLKNLLDFIEKNPFNGEISLVLASQDCLGMQISQQYAIPTYNLYYKNYKNNIMEYSQKITSYLEKYEIDYVIMGGFLSKYLVPKKYENKVISVHPSLTPAFSGKGFYGDKVHEAVFKAKVKISGISIHFVDSEYDTGAIIFQKSCPIKYYDTPKTIKNKISKLEKKFYPKIIQALINDKISLSNGYIKIIK